MNAKYLFIIAVFSLFLMPALSLAGDCPDLNGEFVRKMDGATNWEWIKFTPLSPNSFQQEDGIVYSDGYVSASVGPQLIADGIPRRETIVSPEGSDGSPCQRITTDVTITCKRKQLKFKTDSRMKLCSDDTWYPFQTSQITYSINQNSELVMNVKISGPEEEHQETIVWRPYN